MKSIILISANSEWRAVKEILVPGNLQSTLLGECFEWPVSDQTNSVPDSTCTGLTDLSTLFFHGGWGKVSAAASTQYVIDHYQPDILINLGTCGGFEGRIERETIILVSKTIIYDIIEQMSSADEAIDYYATEIDLSWLREKIPISRSAWIASLC